MLTFQGRENIKSIENYLFSFFPNLGLKNITFCTNFRNKKNLKIPKGYQRP